VRLDAVEDSFDLHPVGGRDVDEVVSTPHRITNPAGCIPPSLASNAPLPFNKTRNPQPIHPQIPPKNRNSYPARRHWDISFTNAPFDVPFSPAVDVLLALVALGGLMAATGAFMFIAIAVKSVFLGEPLGEVVRGRAMAGVPQGLTHPPTHAANVDELNAALHHPSRGIFGVAPGTLALVAVFLLAFVLYYFVNWKVLSFVWKIG
jgi:hypothetical protein